MIHQKVLLDTGPLVAFLNKSDRFHSWSIQKFSEISPPLFTCEAVVSEACFLLSRLPAGISGVMEMLNRKLITIPFRLENETGMIKQFMASYKDVPMSLADACLVRMSEQIGSSVVFTMDGDFRIYRKHRRQVIPVIMPNDG